MADKQRWVFYSRDAIEKRLQKLFTNLLNAGRFNDPEPSFEPGSSEKSASLISQEAEYLCGLINKIPPKLNPYKNAQPVKTKARHVDIGARVVVVYALDVLEKKIYSHGIGIYQGERVSGTRRVWNEAQYDIAESFVALQNGETKMVDVKRPYFTMDDGRTLDDASLQFFPESDLVTSFKDFEVIYASKPEEKRPTEQDIKDVQDQLAQVASDPNLTIVTRSYAIDDQQEKPARPNPETGSSV